MDGTGATEIHAIRHYEPWWRDAEDALGDALHLYDGNALAPVEDITTGSGTQYKVYSSFWKALSQQMPPTDPLPIPHSIAAPDSWPKSDDLADWNLLPDQARLVHRLRHLGGGRTRRHARARSLRAHRR